VPKEGRELLILVNIPEAHRVISAGRSKQVAIGGPRCLPDDVVSHPCGDELLAGGSIPETWLIPDATREAAAIGGPGYRPCREKDGNGGKRLALVDIPEADRVIIAGRGEAAAIGGPGDTNDCTSVSLEGGKPRAGDGIPEGDPAHLIAQGEGVAIGGPGDAVNESNAELGDRLDEWRVEFASGDIPEVRVLTAKGDQTAIGGPGETPHYSLFRVQFVFEKRLAVSDAPDTHGVGHRGEAAAIWRPGHRIHGVRMAGEGKEEVAR
jgi:hypothetical protein